MDKETAINIMIANAVCANYLLKCSEHCPRYKGNNVKCDAPTVSEIKEAVLVLREVRS